MNTSAAIVTGLLLAVANPARAADTRAADGGWKFEITPYLWMAGVEGDITAAGRTAHVSQSFSDLFDKVDAGAELLGIVQYDQVVGLVQVDWLSMSTDSVDRPPTGGRVDSSSLMANLGAGYQFAGFLGGSTVDVLLGARIVYLDDKVTLTGVGSGEKSITIADPVLFVRPSFRILSWLRLNPTVSIGGGLGDSDLTYELQPTLQFQILDNLAARVGYRRVYYKYTGAVARFEGSMSGFLLGVGVTF